MRSGRDALTGMMGGKDAGSAEPGLDVTDAVMARVRAMRGRDAAKRRRYRLSAAAAVCSVVLLSSVTAHAAWKQLQIRNDKGGVILQSQAYQEDPYVKAFGRRLSAYVDPLQASLKPGELAAYAVDDAFLEAGDTANPVKFVYKPLALPTYESFADRSEEMGGLPLPLPEVPAGFELEAGLIHPQWYPAFATDSEPYRALASELTAEAERADDGFAYRLLEWDTAGTTQLMFRNGDRYVSIRADRVPAEGRSDVFVQEGAQSEIVRIGGAEALLVEREDGSFSVYWRDESATVQYAVDAKGIDRKALVAAAESAARQLEPN